MKKQPIKEFQGKYRFLSNFYPCSVLFERRIYPTVEHAYQAAKTLNDKERLQVWRSETPGEAKRMGRKVTMRNDWDTIKLTTMENLLREKFSKEPLKEWLRITKGQELIEGNYWHDTFWGICNGVGENHLGKLLMKIRDQI